MAEEYKKLKDFENFLYLSPNFVFSYTNMSNFVLTAVRGIGKSVISVETAIILKRNNQGL